MLGRGLQGRRQGPGLPGVHGDGEQPLLVDQAVPLAVHRDGPGQPAKLPELVRLSVQGQPSAGEVAENGKGGSPFAHGGNAVPQFTSLGPSPVSLTVRLLFRHSYLLLLGISTNHG